MNENLLFDHDEHGAAKAGSKEALLKHIRGGGAIRVALYSEAPAEDRVTVATPVATYARFDEAYAQLVTVAVTWQPDSPERLTMASPPTSWTVTLSTSGASHRRVVDFNNAMSEDFIYLAVRWYRA